MDKNTKVEQEAAINLKVGSGVAAQNIISAMLAGMKSGDTNTSRILEQFATQQLETVQLRQSVAAGAYPDRSVENYINIQA